VRRRVVVLATGGTIAGEAARATDNVGYTSARRGVHELIAAVPALSGFDLEAEQVAQVDSKDMSHAIWARLARRAAGHLARDEVAGIVVTHGTDTLEETAWLLHRVLAPWVRSKPLVLTAAMRPATSLQADGPQNLLDAVTVANCPHASGVLVAMAAEVWSGAEVRKVHPWRLGAFDAGEAGPVALVREGQVQALRPWPLDVAPNRPMPDDLPERDEDWPWVEIVASHAGASGRSVRALLRHGRADGADSVSDLPHGLVVATTGNGSVHAELLEALAEARAAGVAVLRATRCAGGGILESKEPSGSSPWPTAGALTPAQARVELMLQGLLKTETR
jgi:L-asparaginase